jgi:diguanylate cyclase (GGDEF)-like protein/PAS domain S-box-containing protein
LPTGRTLPDNEWAVRHRWMLRILCAHVVALPLFLLAQGFGAWGSIRPVLPLAIGAWLSTRPEVGRRARSVATVMSLLTASAVLVYGWHGQIEGHFHFFVMIALLALYEDWLPFGLAVAYVALEHGVLGALAPHTVYSHGGSPWLWAAVHGVFVLGASAAAVTSWRLNEDARFRTMEAQAAMRHSSERFHVAFDSGISGMAVQARDGAFLEVNAALCAMLGYSESELLAMSFHDVTHPADREDGAEGHRALIAGSTELYEGEKRYVRRDGTVLWVQIGVKAVRDERGEVEYFIAQTNDITARKHYEEELAHGALHDPLTALPNRVLFADRLTHALLRLRRHPGSVAVLFIDLDRFKLVNDTFGHAAGDAVIIEAGRRLRLAVRDEDTVARFGGDEFTVLCEQGGCEQALAIGQRIVRALTAEPFVHENRSFRMSASVGIRVTDHPGDDVDSMLRDADLALYAAKKSGRGRCVMFDDDVRIPSVDRLTIEEELRLAIGDGQLELHYQPEIDLASGRILAAEALVRWRHPQRGLVPPSEFISVAEDSDLIVELGRWVLAEACRQLVRWRDRVVVDGGFRIAVNLSARQVSQPGLARELDELLRSHGLPSSALCIEITESVLMDDPAAALRNLEEVRRVGAGVALDDFGIGFSSLSRVRDLPVFDVIKIDRSFVAGVAGGGPDAAVVGAVLSLAERLGASAVAEGIETVEQLAALRTLGCVAGQGFLLARPLPGDEIEPLLAGGVVVEPEHV